MKLPFYILDAFVDPTKPFTGNPAALIYLSNDSDIDDVTKQNIAAEFNAGATVFVSKLSPKSDQLLIRWFTTTAEIPLCGHGSLAAVYALHNFPNQFSDLVSADKPLHFVTKYGAKLQATFDGKYVMLNFPLSIPVPIGNAKWLAELQQAVLGNGQNVDWFVDAQLGPNRMAVLRLRDNVDISDLKPDFNAMLQIDSENLALTLLVTKKTNYDDDGTHFVSRVFAPWFGVDEDQACGSAMTVLVPYWSKVYQQEYGQNVEILYAKQASKRTAFMKTQLKGDRVLLSAQVNAFADGVLNV